MECLVDATPEDLTEAIPFEWKDTKTTELPQVGEKEHSWIVLDKHILLKHPLDYWAENQLENKIPMVFGKIISIISRKSLSFDFQIRQFLGSTATAQSEVTESSQEFMDWTDDDKFEAHVEGKLGSFNITIPVQAMEKLH